MAKKALIFGVDGQDGHYLSALLQSKGYELFGAGRKSPHQKATGYYACDIADSKQVDSVVSQVLPDEIYNLAALSSPRQCEEHPDLAFKVNSGGQKAVLDALRAHVPSCRVFHASTAYIFSPGTGPKNENSPMGPTGVYGKSKLEAHALTSQAREEGIHAQNGILFNHESPLRSAEFVTRKITLSAARFKLGLQSQKMRLGRLDSVRDWGFAGDYVQAMWLMLQAKEPHDYVIATGTGHSVQELCDEAFSYAGLDYRKFILSGPEGASANQPDVLVGDPSLIKNDLNWSATTSFAALVRMMVDADLRSGE